MIKSGDRKIEYISAGFVGDIYSKRGMSPVFELMYYRAAKRLVENRIDFGRTFTEMVLYHWSVLPSEDAKMLIEDYCNLHYKGEEYAAELWEFMGV